MSVNFEEFKIFRRYKFLQERCPLCNHKAKVFYCRECIKNGNFSHSKTIIPERYADKLLNRKFAMEKLKFYESNSPAPLRFLARKLALEAQVMETKERIRNCRQSIQDCRVDISIVDAKICEERQNLELLKSNPFRSRIPTSSYEWNRSLEAKRNELNAQERTFKKTIQNNIEILTKNIFPIKRTSLSQEGEVEATISPENETVAALADACQTHYIRGRWVTTSEYPFEQTYQLVTAYLPASGHYSFFGELEPDGIERERKSTRNICAGLSFLTQKVNIIASFTGVSLPKKISFRDFNDFTREDFSEEKFQKFANKLNTNIVYLCVSQGVPSDRLHPARAVPNLMALLQEKQGDLGRQRSFEFSQSLIDAIEEDCISDEMSDSDSDADIELISSEWETVSPLLTDMPYREAAGYAQSTDIRTLPPEMAYSTMTSSGIVSSVMSLWKGLTGAAAHK